MAWTIAAQAAIRRTVPPLTCRCCCYCRRCIAPCLVQPHRRRSFPVLAVPFAAAVRSRTTFRAWVRAPKVPARRSRVFRARTWLGRVPRAPGPLHRGAKSPFPGPPRHVFFDARFTSLPFASCEFLSYGSTPSIAFRNPYSIQSREITMWTLAILEKKLLRRVRAYEMSEIIVISRGKFKWISRYIVVTVSQHSSIQDLISTLWSMIIIM